MSLVKERGRQCFPCSINFSIALQTEILSTVTSDFLKQMIIRKSFNSLFLVICPDKTEKKTCSYQMYAKKLRNKIIFTVKILNIGTCMSEQTM